MGESPATRKFRSGGLLVASPVISQPFRLGDKIGDEDERLKEIDAAFHFSLQDWPPDGLPLEIRFSNDLVESLQNFGP